VERGGLNLYGFVRNSALNAIDDLGRQTARPFPASLAPKHRSAQIVKGIETLDDGLIGFNITIRHGIPPELNTIQIVSTLLVAAFKSGLEIPSASFVTDNFPWLLVKDSLKDGRGYIDDVFENTANTGKAIVTENGLAEEDLCRLDAEIDSTVGTANAQTIDKVIKEFWPNTPDEDLLENNPDLGYMLDSQDNALVLHWGRQALALPKISFGLKVNWTKGENGEKDKETHELSGDLKK
jgi:hypothetical protein